MNNLSAIPNKPILYIDMDGVIADFDSAIKRFDPYLHTGDNYSDYKGRANKVNYICQQNPRIFNTLTPIYDAIDSVHKLFPIYDVYFLSVPMWHVPESFTDKRIWIDRHFGELSKERLILTHRKDLNKGKYLIDDRLRHGVSDFSGEHIHFGSEKYPDWASVVSYLIK